MSTKNNKASVTHRFFKNLRQRPIFYGIVAILTILFVGWFMSIPKYEFNAMWSSVLYDNQGNMIAAELSADDQFRFKPGNSVPEKLKICIITFEDQRFQNHMGVDFRAMGRAVIQNAKAKKIVRGASTLSMQVIRMMRNNQERSFANKFSEILQAIHLDLKLEKDSILTLWATHAPFGGNVVGYEAAAWRYFGRSSDNLSWAEAAMLAVLPNAPALILPGRNTNILKQKRDLLLKKLVEKSIIDVQTAELAIEEPIPTSVIPIPSLGRYLLQSHEKLFGFAPTQKTKSTINSNLQESTVKIAQQYARIYKQSKIEHIAILVLETKTGNVLSYVGNVGIKESENHWVDIIPALRSPGSTLKPVLFGSMIGKGELTSQMLIRDVPMNIDGYMPRNFNGKWNGILHADEALCRSVNVPFVNLLQQHGIVQFNETLKKLGITSLTKDPSHYGLSIILGGAETSLWETTGMYASMGRVLLNYGINSGNFQPSDIHPPQIYIDQKHPISRNNTYPITPSGIWATFEALQKPERPDIERGWQYFTTSRKVAWKTGTSFGFRDAWAIGLDPEYTVGVWVGNANGTSASGLVGILKAAPILFEVFNLLPQSQSWFLPPHDDLRFRPICRESGYPPNEHCPNIDTVLTSDVELKTGLCPFHRSMQLTSDGKYRTAPDCNNNYIDTVWFAFPPIIEHYYRKINPRHTPIPQPDPTCFAIQKVKSLQIIYPYPNSEIYIPIEIDGSQGRIILEAAHSKIDALLFWHLDGEFIQTTTRDHKVSLFLDYGTHNLLITDEDGNITEINFKIIAKKRY
ncbi:MAG: penicillin-binding protein 1C [Salinivirgaceae bacterium]|nr:penicillin-binding protein 1C [Salinivirgaceae bacterium]